MSISQVGKSLWKLVGGTGYDPDKFYTKSTDGNGHYERIPQTKITPSMEAMISELMGQFPTEYKSQGDVVRDALMHLVVYRSQNSAAALANIELQVKRMAADEARAREVAEIEAWHVSLNALRDDVAILVNKANWVSVTEALTTAEEMLENDQLPDWVRQELSEAIHEGWAQVRIGTATKRRKRYTDAD